MPVNVTLSCSDTTYPLEGCHLILAHLLVIGLAADVVLLVVRVCCLALSFKSLVASLTAGGADLTLESASIILIYVDWNNNEESAASGAAAAGQLLGSNNDTCSAWPGTYPWGFLKSWILLLILSMSTLICERM